MFFFFFLIGTCFSRSTKMNLETLASSLKPPCFLQAQAWPPASRDYRRGGIRPQSGDTSCCPRTECGSAIHVYMSRTGVGSMFLERPPSSPPQSWCRPQNCVAIIYLRIKGTGYRFRLFPGAVTKTPGDRHGKFGSLRKIAGLMNDKATTCRRGRGGGTKRWLSPCPSGL